MGISCIVICLARKRLSFLTLSQLQADGGQRLRLPSGGKGRLRPRAACLLPPLAEGAWLSLSLQHQPVESGARSSGLRVEDLSDRRASCQRFLCAGGERRPGGGELLRFGPTLFPTSEECSRNQLLLLSQSQSVEQNSYIRKLPIGNDLVFLCKNKNNYDYINIFKHYISIKRF